MDTFLLEKKKTRQMKMKSFSNHPHELDIANAKKYTEFGRRATDVTLLAQSEVLVRSPRAIRRKRRNEYTAEKVTVQNEEGRAQEARNRQEKKAEGDKVDGRSKEADQNLLRF